MNNEKIEKIIKKMNSIIKELESLKMQEQMEGQVSLEIDANEVAKRVTDSYKKQLIEEHFEKVWKKLISTPYDKKKNVTKDTKVRLYDYTLEQIEKAIQNYYNTTNPNYRMKKDNFLNNSIWFYLDEIEKQENQKSNFSFGGF